MIVLEQKREDVVDFSIVSPGTAARWAVVEKEFDALWELLTDAGRKYYGKDWRSSKADVVQ